MPASVDGPVVRMSGITKRFSGSSVLKGVDFDCLPGEIHALLGANGAGKSTLIQILTGVYRPDEGVVEVDGEPVRFRRPADAEGAGISAVYQELSLVDDLSVAENIYLGHELRRGWRIDREMMRTRARALFDEFGLELDPDARLKGLSVARRQLVEIAKALARNARLIILDEPTASLTSDEQERLLTTLLDLRDTGLACIYVSHRLDEVLRIADRITVLRDGQVASVEAIANTRRERIVEAMVGSPEKLEAAASRSAAAPVGSRAEVEPLLSVEGLCGPKFEGVTFDVKPGEIVAIAGVIGSGRSSLLNTLFGVWQATSGSVSIRGSKSDLRTVRSAINEGVALIPEDRHSTGLATMLSVQQNISAVRLRSLWGFYSPRSDRQRAAVVASTVALEHDVRMETRHLSGGNQQKVVLAKWLAVTPQVLLCDEPTRGIDVGARSEIYAVLRGLADQGAAVVVSSSYLDEVLILADRVFVMARGRIVAEFEAANATEQILMSAASGNPSQVS